MDKTLGLDVLTIGISITRDILSDIHTCALRIRNHNLESKLCKHWTACVGHLELFWSFPLLRGEVVESFSYYHLTIAILE